MAVLNPHFRPEHQKGHVMLAGHADAGGTHILLQNAHSLNVLNNALEEGHSVIFNNVAVFVDQQHTQIMNIEMLLALLVQAVHILHDKLVGLLMLGNFLAAQLINLGHSLMGQTHSTAALPAFCNPGMHVGIDNPLIHKLLIV